jgi:flagellar hook-associated protein 2
MAGIQSSTGLITGIPIQDTVDKLMAIAAQPKNTLSNRTKLLESEKLAVTQLTSLLVAFQFESNQLGAASIDE